MHGKHKSPQSLRTSASIQSPTASHRQGGDGPVLSHGGTWSSPPPWDPWPGTAGRSVADTRPPDLFHGRSLWQELLVGHCEAAHVPEDPEDQAEEDEERPRQDEEVPKADGCKDPGQQEAQAHQVEDQRQHQEEGAALAGVVSTTTVHGRAG